MRPHLIEVWTRKAAQWDAVAAQWDQKIADNPDAGNHKLGIWKAKATQARRAARLLRERIEREKES